MYPLAKRSQQQPPHPKNQVFAVTLLLIIILLAPDGVCKPDLSAALPMANEKKLPPLSETPVEIFYKSGDFNDTAKIRFFASDDFGLRNFLENIKQDKIELLNPYYFFPDSEYSQRIFIGIADPDQIASGMTFNAEEIRRFSEKGGLVILLTHLDRNRPLLNSLGVDFKTDFQKGVPRSLVPLSENMNWNKLNNNATAIEHFVPNSKGGIVIMGDSFAFSNARFQQNKTLWKGIIEKYGNRTNVRMIQRKRYTHKGRAIYHSGNSLISSPLEEDPAFAPSFTDSNNSKFYSMTQGYYFSKERYWVLPDQKKEFHFGNMIRVNVFDNFIPPNKGNPKAWHFARSLVGRSNLIKVSKSHTKNSHTQEPFRNHMIKLLVETAPKKDAPPDRVLLASGGPKSALLKISLHEMRSEADIRKREKVLLEKIKLLELKYKKSKKKRDAVSLFKDEDGNRDKELLILDDKIKKAKSEYVTEKNKNDAIMSAPLRDRAGRKIEGVKLNVIADSLNNWRIETTPPLSTLPELMISYTVEVQNSYLRNQMQNFKEDLIPNNLLISEVRKKAIEAGIKPARIPEHEKQALIRLIARKKNLIYANDYSTGHYLPKDIEDALNGRDIPVKKLFRVLSDYLSSFNDAPIFLKDEFNSFSEAMLYSKAGVCRHRARIAFMILNTIGIPARCVVSRTHAFSEVYLPRSTQSSSPFWTQVNYGGGAGSDPSSDYGFIIPQSEIATQEDLGKDQFKLNFSNQIITLILLSPLLLILWLIFLKRFKNPDRVPMTINTDFMRSQQDLLQFDAKHGNYQGAAMVLIEACSEQLYRKNIATVKMGDDVKFKKLLKLYNSLHNGQHCSKKRYLEIVCRVHKLINNIEGI